MNTYLGAFIQPIIVLLLLSFIDEEPEIWTMCVLLIKARLKTAIKTQAAAKATTLAHNENSEVPFSLGRYGPCQAQGLVSVPSCILTHQMPPGQMLSFHDNLSSLMWPPRLPPWMSPLNPMTDGWVIWGKDGGDGCGVTFLVPSVHRSPHPKLLGVAAPKDGQEESQKELWLCRCFVDVINIYIVDA